jgi:hypothetical protein
LPSLTPFVKIRISKPKDGYFTPTIDHTGLHLLTMIDQSRLSPIRYGDARKAQSPFPERQLRPFAALKPSALVALVTSPVAGYLLGMLFA